MMKKILLRTFISSILAGFCIVFGASVYLICANHAKQDGYIMNIIGSLIFAIGLFTIIHFKLWLYTGRVGGLLEKYPKYVYRLLVCLIANILGVMALSLVIKFTGGANAMQGDYLNDLVEAKLDQNFWSALVRSMLCGMMIYVAYKGHKICDYPLGKVLFAFLPISLFILCGYDHVIANAAYFTFAGAWSTKLLWLFPVWALGNGIGAIILDGSLKLIVRLDDRKWHPAEKDSIGLDKEPEKDNTENQDAK